MKKVLAALRARLLAAATILLVAVFLSCGSMLISFFAVQYLTRGPSDEGPVDPVQLNRARMLRTFSNELVGLCNRYAVRVPRDGSTVSSANRVWIERGFRPDLRYLAQRMDDTILGDVPEYELLRSAAARCAAMARHPEDRGLRARALHDVRFAVDSIEVYIGRITSGRYLAPPRTVPRFGSEEGPEGSRGS